MKTRIFVDMDGTLAEFNTSASMEQLHEPGYFFKLQPIANVKDAIKRLCSTEGENYEVFVLTNCLADTNARQEKSEWLDRFLPEIDSEHRIFSLCGVRKADAVPGGLSEDDVLLDDFSVNLHEWVRDGGRAIKLLNGINGNKGSWHGETVSFSLSPDAIAEKIISTAVK